MSVHAHARGRALLAIVMWTMACLLLGGVLVYLGQRLRGLGVFAAMLTDFGRVGRFGGRPPVWLDAPPSDALQLAHLSDLHVAENESIRVIEHQRAAGNRTLPLLFARPEVQQADVLLITGDVTDRGTQASWTRVLEALDAHGVRGKTILVPGNHDIAYISVVSRSGGGPEDRFNVDRFGIVSLGNLFKFAETFSQTLGGQAGVVIDEDKRPLPFSQAFSRLEEETRGLLVGLPDVPIPLEHAELSVYRRRIEKARQRLFALFPIAVPVGSAVLYVVNSCEAVFRHPMSNGMGYVGRGQYKRLFRLGNEVAAPIRLVALHHHVVRRAEEQSLGFLPRIYAKFNVLSDAAPLIRFCKKNAVRAVFHGHRHLSYQLRLQNGTVLCAAPSSTLGDELSRDPRPQLELYRVAVESGGISVGMHRTAVHL
jgi:hypothetical protein